MDDSTYHTIADRLLETILEALEAADQSGALEADLESGVLTVELQDGRQYVLSKHAPTRQIWLSSPVTGGHHFVHEEKSGLFILPRTNQTLGEILADELQQQTGLKLDL